jgi:hypothetical protein
MQRRKFKKEKGMYIVNRPYGETVTYHKNTLYPVDSLLPPVVTKTVKFFDLGAEEVR